LSLFGVDNLHLTFNYEIDPASNASDSGPSNRFSGTVTYSGDLFGTHNPLVHFSFANDQFSLSDWKISHDGQGVFDVAESIMKASATDDKTCSCGPLVGLELDGLKTMFNFNLSFRSSALQDSENQLSLTAISNVSVDISVGAKSAASVDLGSLQIVIPAPFKKDQLLSSLANCIQENVVRTGKRLLDHPDELAETILLLNVENFSKHVTKNLLCRNLKPKNLVKHALDLADVEATALLNKAVDVVDLASTAIPDPGLPIPGPATLAAYTAALTSFEALTTTMGAVSETGSLVGFLLGLALSPLPVLSLGKKRDQAEAKRREAEAALNSARKSIEDALVLRGQPTLKFVASDSVVVDWSDCLPNNMELDFKVVEWTVRFTDPATENSLDDCLTTSNGTFRCKRTNPHYLFERSVRAWIQGVIRYDRHSFTASAWTETASAFHRHYLRPPDSVNVIAVDKDFLTIQFPKEVPLQDFEVEVRPDTDDPNGVRDRLYVGGLRTDASGVAKIALQELRHDPELQEGSALKVLARSSPTTGDAAFESVWVTAPESIPIVPAPHRLSVSIVGGLTVLAQWEEFHAGKSGQPILDVRMEKTGEPVKFVERILFQALGANNTSAPIRLSFPPDVAGENLSLTVHFLAPDGFVSLRAATAFSMPVARPPSMASMAVGRDSSRPSSPAFVARPSSPAFVESASSSTITTINQATTRGSNAFLSPDSLELHKSDRSVGLSDANTIRSSNPLLQSLSRRSTRSSVLEDGHFRKGDLKAWNIQGGVHTTTTVKRGITGRYKLLLVVNAPPSARSDVGPSASGSSSTLWLSQSLKADPGTTYEVSVKGRFLKTDEDSGCCSVYIDGVAVISMHSSGSDDKIMGTAKIVPRWERPVLEVNISATWGESVMFELGAIDVRPVKEGK
jgi:hypothetical protein